jgi:hypothetical protein
MDDFLIIRLFTLRRKVDIENGAGVRARIEPNPSAVRRHDVLYDG